MSNEFLPVPAEGKKYHSEVDGSEYLVTHVELDPQSSYVEAINVDNENLVELGPDEWNNCEFTLVDSVTPPLQVDAPVAPEEEDTKGGKSEPIAIESVDPHIVPTVDPKLNRLHLFLHNKPLEQMPFDFPETVFRFKTEHDEQIKENDVLETDVENYINENFYKREIEERRAEGRKKENHSTKLNELLWTCAGVDKPLIRMCPQDKAKKAGIGGTILFTSLMAALSGTLVISTMFESAPFILCLLFGLFWGALIFNLDRYMTNSMYSDGTSRITLLEWRSALPRIVIAVFLGVVISTPIVLKMFDGEIKKTIEQEHKNYRDELDADSTYYANGLLARLEEELAGVEKRYDIAWNRWQASKNSFDQEVDEGSNGRARGYGDVAKQKQKTQEEDKEEVDRLQTQIDSIKAKIARVEGLKDLDSKKVLAAETGLAPKLKTLFKLDGRLQLVHLILALFFIILELMPVLSKMMAENGEYEKFLEAESDAVAWKLQIKKYNLQNLIHSGKLQRYERLILSVNDDKSGGKDRKRRDANEDHSEPVNEGELIFQKRDFLFENKRRVEEANHNVIEEAVRLVEDYTISLMREIFSDIHPVGSAGGHTRDISDGAMEI